MTKYKNIQHIKGKIGWKEGLSLPLAWYLFSFLVNKKVFNIIKIYKFPKLIEKININ